MENQNLFSKLLDEPALFLIIVGLLRLTNTFA